VRIDLTLSQPCAILVIVSPYANQQHLVHHKEDRDEYLRQTVVVKTTSSIVEIGVETERKTTATLHNEGWFFFALFSHKRDG